MALLYRRLLDYVLVTTGDSIDLAEALDLGEYRELHLVINVVQEGEGEAPKLLVKHAPTNAEGAFLDFATPVEVDLTSAGAVWFEVPSFTRWLGWFTSGTFTSDAMVTLDVIAKG